MNDHKNRFGKSASMNMAIAVITVLIAIAAVVPTSIQARGGESQIRLRTGDKCDKIGLIPSEEQEFCNPMAVNYFEIEGWNQNGDKVTWKSPICTAESSQNASNWWWAFERGVTLRWDSPTGRKTFYLKTKQPTRGPWVDIFIRGYSRNEPHNAYYFAFYRGNKARSQ